jgi:hypothetical membrane protein
MPPMNGTPEKSETESDVGTPSPSGSSSRHGPLVHRSVHHGALLLMIATVQFIVAMIVAQLAWTNPTYSLTHNYISDLGNTMCGPFAGTDVCSPLHIVFNVSAIVFGLLVLLATLLLPRAFREGMFRTVGLGLFFIAGLGAILVGSFPENTIHILHYLGAFMAFAGGGFALVFLSLAMIRDTRWDGFRFYTFLSGALALIFLVIFALGAWKWGGFWSTVGVGGWERLVVAPILLWLIVAGLHLYRIPTYAPSGVHPTAPA